MPRILCSASWGILGVEAHKAKSEALRGTQLAHLPTHSNLSLQTTLLGNSGLPPGLHLNVATAAPTCRLLTWALVPLPRKGLA